MNFADQTKPPDEPADENCKLPPDVVLRSSDGVSLGAHKKYLEIYSHGFPLAENFPSSKEQDVVDLPEDADVLRLVLKYTHPFSSPPDIGKIPSSLVIRFAEAVEKYGVMLAMEGIRYRMRYFSML